VIRVATAEDMDEVRNLFEEYATSLSVDLCFQNFAQELAALPGVYDPILLCCVTDLSLSGCVALRPLSDGVAEMKRLYVRPQHRGEGIGRKLIEAVIEAAGKKGYRSIRLDTLPEMQKAIALYRQLGFQEIPPYCTNPVQGALFMELKIESPGRIIGIGGIFFKSPDHQALRAWYQEKLGIQDDGNGAMFKWSQGEADHVTVWSVFPGHTDYFNPSKAGFMINYIVDDMDAFLAKCAANGVAIDPKREDHEYGRFAWIFDPDGNKIELWQPPSSAAKTS